MASVCAEPSQTGRSKPARRSRAGIEGEPGRGRGERSSPPPKIQEVGAPASAREEFRRLQASKSDGRAMLPLVLPPPTLPFALAPCRKNRSRRPVTKRPELIATRPRAAAVEASLSHLNEARAPTCSSSDLTDQPARRAPRCYTQNRLHVPRTDLLDAIKYAFLAFFSSSPRSTIGKGAGMKKARPGAPRGRPGSTRLGRPAFAKMAAPEGGLAARRAPRCDACSGCLSLSAASHRWSPRTTSGWPAAVPPLCPRQLMNSRHRRPAPPQRFARSPVLVGLAPTAARLFS